MTARQRQHASTAPLQTEPVSLRRRYSGRTPAQEAAFEARVEAHRVWVEAYRAEHGDPWENMQKWALETFGEDVLRRMSEEFADEYPEHDPSLPPVSRPE